MAKTKVTLFYLAWVLLAMGVFFAVRAAVNADQSVKWEIVKMDGHRIQASCVTSDNASTALGTFEGDEYVAPSGARYAAEGSVAGVAKALFAAQETLLPLKKVICYSADNYENLRTVPDLPLGNLVADALRSFSSERFKCPIDFALTNYGGIRVPLPEGAVTYEDISSMLPFKNYISIVKMKGSNLTKQLEMLATTPAFGAVSGVRVKVKGHRLVSAEVGGQPIDPDRIYNVATVDFLLDGGDNINVAALAEDVQLTHVLIKEALISYLEKMNAQGTIVEPVSDGRVIMED